MIATKIRNTMVMREPEMTSATLRRLTALGLALGLASFLAAGCDEDASPTTPAPAPPAAPPPPPATTPEPPQIGADEVVDRDTLKSFVERAATVLAENASDRETAYTFLDENFRPEGEWRHREIYVFVDTMELINFFHAHNPEIEGTDRSGGVDLNGVRVLHELRAAAQAGGGYVEFLHDNPAVDGDEETKSLKVAYATAVTVGSEPMILTSGIYPPVTAADVRNRGTLRSFVERAATVLAENASDLETAYAFLDANFREEGEWRHGQVYVFAQTMELINFFHAFRPEIEGLDRSENQDVNGVKINQELRAAVLSGDGYVEYWYDNPAVEGDEETGSPKVAYATIVTIGSTPLIFGSGIYPEQPGGE